MAWFKGRETDSGAKTQIYLGGSKTVLGFANQAQRRQRFVLIGLGVGTVVIGITGLGVMKYLEAQAAKRVLESYGSLTRCLLAEPPTDGETPSRRFRSIQLTSLTQSEIARAADKAGPWPDRCAKYAHGLHESIGESAIGKEKGKPLAEAAKALGEALDQKDGYWRDASAAIDRAFTEAATAGIVLQPKPDIPAPPDRTRTLDVDALAKAGALTNKPIALADLHVQAASLGEIRFVLDDPKNGVRRVCTIASESASCTDAPKALATIKGAIRPVGTSDSGASALLAAGDGVFNAAGAKLLDGPALGASGHANGAATLLVETTSGLELRRASNGNASTVSLGLGTLKIANPKHDARIFWDHVVAIAQSGKETVLAAGSLDGTAPELDVVGSFPKATSDRSAGSEARLDGCQSNGVTVVRARLGRDEYLSFQSKNAWSNPLKLSLNEATLQCHNGQAVLTKVEGGSGEASLDATIARLQCGPTECRSAKLTTRDFFAGETNLAASTPLAVATVDGKTMVAWQAGQRGGLRLRLGALEKLGGTPDAIVFDDLVQGGKVVDGSSILDLRLLSAERFGVLLLVTPSGLRALRIGSDGTAAPVTL